MKKSLKIIGIIIALVLVFFVASIVFVKENMRVTMKAVIIKVDERSLEVMGLGSGFSLCNMIYGGHYTGLYSLGFSEDIGFKQAQEILIYFDGDVAESYPAQYK